MKSDGPSPRTPGVARARLHRVIVHAPGDATTGARIAERLPATLQRALAAAGPLDERALRANIERAAREASR